MQLVPIPRNVSRLGRRPVNNLPKTLYVLLLAIAPSLEKESRPALVTRDQYFQNRE